MTARTTSGRVAMRPSSSILSSVTTPNGILLAADLFEQTLKLLRLADAEPAQELRRSIAGLGNGFVYERSARGRERRERRAGIVGVTVA